MNEYPDAMASAAAAGERSLRRRVSSLPGDWIAWVVGEYPPDCRHWRSAGYAR